MLVAQAASIWQARVQLAGLTVIGRDGVAAVGAGDLSHGPGTTFHDLRHYNASLLVTHGESVKVVEKRLGHKSAVETLDTYSRLWLDTEDGTREAFDMVLGRVRTEDNAVDASTR